jgi:hypothetical protein
MRWWRLKEHKLAIYAAQCRLVSRDATTKEGAQPDRRSGQQRCVGGADPSNEVWSRVGSLHEGFREGTAVITGHRLMHADCMHALSCHLTRLTGHKPCREGVGSGWGGGGDVTRS